MILTLMDRTSTEAVLLSRSENKMRVVMQGCDDPIELTEISGVWISEDCKPVQVEFAWQKKTHSQVVEEEDHICSHKLASRLIHLLWNGTGEQEMASAEDNLARCREGGTWTEVL